MWDQELYIKAFRFAAEAHGSQKVPGSEISYLFHISLVASEAASVLFQEDIKKPDLMIQCAILHDTVEDTDTTREMIETIFGEEVAAGVDALTKPGDMLKEAAMKESIARIRHQPREIWMVKLADRITNLQPPPDHWTRQRCDEYREEAFYILKTLGEASPFLAGRMAQKISRYEEYCS